MRVLVCDGTYLLYRVWFTSGWSLGDAESLTGGCYGVLKSVHSALDRINDVTKVIVVWDGGRSQRRKTLYPEYKANRSQKNDINYDEFELQYQLLVESLALLGVQSLKFPDREGDDVIYWITRLAGDAVILSDDKDMLLMLAPTVDVYRPGKDQYCTWDSFTEEHGYSPDKYIIEKSIVGDSSDNIKGVTGAGEKTARAFTQLAGQVGLNEALRRAKTDKSARIRKIPEQVGTLTRNIELMDFKYEPTRETELAEIQDLLLTPTAVDKEAFHAFCRKHQFASMMNDGWLSPFIKATRGRV